MIDVGSVGGDEAVHNPVALGRHAKENTGAHPVRLCRGEHGGKKPQTLQQWLGGRRAEGDRLSADP